MLPKMAAELAAEYTRKAKGEDQIPCHLSTNKRNAENHWVSFCDCELKEAYLAGWHQGQLSLIKNEIDFSKKEARKYPLTQEG